MANITDLRKLKDIEVLNRTILHKRPHGVLQVGVKDIPLNMAVQRLGGMKKLQQLANRYFNRGGASSMFGANERFARIGTQAEQVLDRMIGLSFKQSNAITKYVNNEVMSGVDNFELTDEFYCLALEQSALVGFKSLTATNYGATFDNTGATADGVSQYIGTGIIPSDNANRLNNVDAQCFCVENYDTTQGAGLFYVNEGGSQLGLAQQTAQNRINGSVNKSTGLLIYGDDGFQNDTLYGVDRENATQESISKNGANGATASVNSSSQPADEILLGTTGTVNLNAKLGSFKYGASIGFDQSAHNTNVRQLLSDLAS